MTKLSTLKHTAFSLLLLLLFSASSFSQELIPVTKEGLEEIMRSGQGKIRLVNLWATWCRPCVEEFPELLKTRENNNEDSFELILISLDFGEGNSQKVLNFLRKSGVEFKTYISSFDKDEELIDFFDKSWEGAIPATFVFKPDGTLSSSMIGKRTYEEFDAAIKKASSE